MFCERPKFKIGRHLEHVHEREPEVARLTLLLPDTKDQPDTKKLKKKLRKEGFDILRKKGDYNHNYDVLRKGNGELIVERCPPHEVPFTEFLPCEFCLSYYYRKDLHRHIKTCKSRMKENVDSNSHNRFRVQSRAAMLLPIHDFSA